MKLIVAGGRNFDNTDYLIKCLTELANEGKIPDEPELVCGMAPGADRTAWNLWHNANMPIHAFPANWNKFGKRAGIIRNAEMGDYADVLVAFWDGQSKGTKHMIEYMTKLGKPVYVFKY